MKILHLSASLSRRAGGIFEIELALALNQRRLGIDALALGLADSEWAKDSSRWSPIPASVCPIRGPRLFGYSPTLLRELLTADADLVHLHYMWMYPSLAVTQWAAQTRRPFLVSPNGMLEPWALRNSAWKKKLAGILYENRMLRGAACLHANTMKEATDIRAFGLKNPIAVIPNGVDLDAFGNPPDRSILEQRFPTLKGRRWVLFLSRIHPKKGLPHLLRAWSAVLNSQSSIPDTWTLLVAGPDELGHETEMKQLADGLNLHKSVVFTGPLHGAEKLVALSGAELFVLPSFSEGFSMAILEAAAAGMPVILTPHCNFPELAECGGAIEVAPNAESCAEGLRRLLTLPEAGRRDMGQRGKELIARHYTWPRVAEEMLSVYRWLLGTGPQPDCVQLI